MDTLLVEGIDPSIFKFEFSSSQKYLLLQSSQDSEKCCTHNRTSYDPNITCPSFGYGTSVIYLRHRGDYDRKPTKERE